MLPSLTDYMQTFQNPQLFLTDRVLAGCTCPKDQQGQPEVQSGGFALTFCLTGNGRKWAVRCFHREVSDRDKRYTAISSKLNQPETKQSGYFVDFEYQTNGVVVKGVRYPIVKMAWAQGQTLGSFLEKNYNNPRLLNNLKVSLRQLYAFLVAHHIAHGDIQPGNLMVSSDGTRVQLIDYDGMFVDGTQGLSAAETGVPNFQHPERGKTNPWNEKIDRFPFIVLDIALSVLAVRPEYWTKTQSSDEKVLFETTDYAVPYGSQTFNELKGDPRFSQQISALQQICQSDFDSIPCADNYIGFKGVAKQAKRQSQQAVQISYKGNFPVVYGADTWDFENRVGQVVEIVGKIVQIKEGTTKYKRRPYYFLNFVPWSRNSDSFRIVLWSEHIDQLGTMGVYDVNVRYLNQYVSIVGMVAEYVGGYNHTFQLVPKSASSLKIISADEAEFRLGRKKKTIVQSFGGTVAAQPVKQNVVLPASPASNAAKVQQKLGGSTSYTSKATLSRQAYSARKTPPQRQAYSVPKVTPPIATYTAPKATTQASTGSNVDKLKQLKGIGSCPSGKSTSGSSPSSSGSKSAQSGAPSKAPNEGCCCLFWIVVVVVVIIILSRAS